jgi:hypothetical protein
MFTDYVYSGSTRRVASHYQLKIDTISKYKFVLAFENTNSKDYVTEKIYHAFLAGTIPVYMGAPNAKNFIPFENSYINASGADISLSIDLLTCS